MITGKAIIIDAHYLIHAVYYKKLQNKDHACCHVRRLQVAQTLSDLNME